MNWLRLLALCCLVLPASAQAGRVEIPLRVSLETVREALAAQLAASSARPQEVLREGRCTYLSLEPPRLEAVDGRLRLSGPGKGALGADLLGQCQSAAAWQGTMEFTLVPSIDSAGRLRVAVSDSRLITPSGDKAPAIGLLWDLVKRQVHPRLEQFSFDLGASRSALVALLRSAAPPQHASSLELALGKLQVLQPRVEASHVAVPVAFEVPDAWLAAPPAASAAPLTDAELAALEKSLEPLDAFLVYSLRQIARDSADVSLRNRLFTLLLESRYALVAILAGDAPASQDPVRSLFIDTWNGLRAILGDARRDGLLDASVLRYAVFVDAGDALVALERAAPGLGMHLSADSLRQLARALSPGASSDPLAYEWNDDAELRRLFDVEELREPAPAPAPGRSWLDLLIGTAHASGGADAARPREQWIPTQDELTSYEKHVGELLEKAAAAELQRTGLPAPHADTYDKLVPTTALIESCWRQYVVRGGKATYLRSRSGSVGIMQVNQIVWRGFYDIQRLRWDTAYNMRAGTQILMRYVKDYAIPYAQRSGDPTHVPRAAYAVYNAGPRAVGRFNKPDAHPRESRVDEKLWTLYKGLASGGEVDLRSCGVRRPVPAG
jgi:hypothetical protein